MRNALTLWLATLTVVSVAQERAVPDMGLVPEIVPPPVVPDVRLIPEILSPVPTRRIVPSEIVPESIQRVRFTNKMIGVRWTYTQAGAANMLAFREAHEGQTVRTVIGAYECRPHEISRIGNYAQWKEGWLKHRGDKIVGVSEEDADRIVAGLKSTQ